jgi:hypothetical protein
MFYIEGLSAYRAVNTLHFGYKNQSQMFTYKDSVRTALYTLSTSVMKTSL